jgi:hypothetical protein
MSHFSNPNSHVVKCFSPDLESDENLRKGEIRAARVILDPPDELGWLHQGPLAVGKIIGQVRDRRPIDDVNLKIK